MIFLTSNGLTSEKLQTEFKKAIENTGNKCVVIPTAMEKDKDKDIWLEETRQELAGFGLECDYFYFGTDYNEKLADYDIIYICGGNVFYLMQMIKQCCAEEILAKAAREKIIVGVSAGSLIMQADLVLIRDLIPRMNKRVKLKDLTALNLTNGLEHLPHRARYTEIIDAFEKRVKTYQRKAGHEVICLEDGQGIIIEGETHRIIM
ncbi:MAG: Type 1 glutamine amidotransferase-like domain-containing protein [Oscillospiraceae bacterium]|nr:Type 1 glutamine amidotransferase-like domain-containing protein [Oscillospiraceae bacterium]